MENNNNKINWHRVGIIFSIGLNVYLIMFMAWIFLYLNDFAK
jgi:hypothetical protein